MDAEHHIYCGGLPAHGLGAGDSLIEFNLWPNHPDCNVTLRIEELRKRFFKHTAPQFLDLLEIATYVYCADQYHRRGVSDVKTLGANWRRHLHFRIPVRRPGIWKRAEVKQALTDTLDFLSDDIYEFEFVPAEDPPKLPGYFDLEEDGEAKRGAPEMVMMFSGGLDSLGGAVREILVKRKNVVLLNHKSTPKFGKLYEALYGRIHERADGPKPMQVRLEIHKDSDLTKEPSQRSRSFLYAALGVVTARMLRLDRLNFFENGVVSMNLPICAQVIGSRATRTTHPRVLAGFSKLFSLLAEERFLVENAFLWHTKSGVVREITGGNCGDLIALSRSCAHTWETSNEFTHCGLCTQCIDRRFGVIAAKAEGFDPLEHYKKDLFLDARPEAEDRITGAAYLEKAISCAGLRDVSRFISENPEVIRILPHLEGDMVTAARRVLDLHRKHASEVMESLDIMTKRHLEKLIRRTLPMDALLRLVFESSAPVVLAGSEAANITRRDGGSPGQTHEVIHTKGQLRYRDGFEDVWFRDNHYDLRSWKRARFCLEYMVKQDAIDPESAASLEDEIDAYVREKTKMPRAADLRIDHYFNDRDGKLKKLRKDLIHSAGGGRYYLKVD